MSLKNEKFNDDFYSRLREYMEKSLNCQNVDAMFYLVVNSSGGMLELVDRQIEQTIKNLTELDSKNFKDHKDQEIKM